MAYFYMFISAVLLQIVPSLFAHQINCSLHDIYSITADGNLIDLAYDGMINVAYDRTDLAIYSYNFTQFVNFLLNDVEITFDGEFTKAHDTRKLASLLKTNLEGIAFLKKNSNKTSPLTKCHLDLEKNVFKNDLDENIQKRIIDLAHACIQPKLCAQLGNSEPDDFIRAKIETHDFAENSVMYEVLDHKYPNLALPNPKNKTQTGLQVTINLLADFWLASIATLLSGKNNGQVTLPDVNETIPGVPLISQGYFKLNKGEFGNLKYVTRTKNVNVTNKGLEFAVEASFQLPKARIHYDHYALKYGPVNTEGKVDIDIEGIDFKIKVTMNYNKSPCKIAVADIHSEVGNISFNLRDSSIFDGWLSDKVTNLIRKYTHNLINFLEMSLKNVISEPLNNFDCEKYRP